MFKINIEKMVPRFILNDTNGYAIAKAIEAALQKLNDAVLEGLKCIADHETMPEWRLDELAWEYDILYDYNADIATKRKWIANAIQFYKLYGTPAGIVKYLEAAFDSARIEEWWEYGAEPYHFRAIVTGEWSEEANEWAYRAIEQVKNVRSVLDDILFSSDSVQSAVYTAAAAVGVEIAEEATSLDEVEIIEVILDGEATVITRPRYS